MIIQELTKEESLTLLKGMNLGRLACVSGTQPYIVPIHFVVDDHYLYGFSTVGKKIEWMRANPHVCVEADEIVSRHQWITLVLTGMYQELTDTPEWLSVRVFAHELLQKRALWWEPGYVQTVLSDGTQRPLLPLYYRIHIMEISGRRAVQDSRFASGPKDGASASALPAPGLLQRMFARKPVKS